MNERTAGSTTYDTQVGSASATAAAPLPTWRRVLASAVLGNVVEWYDNALYGILAVFMAKAFFPEGNQQAALLGTYVGLIFAYAIRPIAGVLMGRFSDLHGHRRALTLSIVLMTLGTVLIGVLPTYAAIGIVAPLLLAVCRLIQGVGASAEYTIAANFILEHGPRDRRQYLSGWSVGSTSLGPLLASIVSTALLVGLDDASFQSWGWRLPFLLAAPMGLVTFLIRRSAPELPRTQEQPVVQAPFKQALRDHWREMLLVIGLGAGQRVGTFCIQAYFVTALINAGFSESRALFASILTYLIGPPAAIWGGKLADERGGRWVLIIGYSAFVLFTVPTFHALTTTSLAVAAFAVVGFTFINNFVGAPLTHAYVMTFKPEVRGTAAALNFNLGTTLIGSTAPLIAAWLHGSTGTDSSFAWYMTAVCAVSLVIALFAYPRASKD